MKKLRSNSKEVRDAIKLHLIEIAENDDVEVKTVDQAKKYIINKFYIEMIKHDKHYNNNIKDLFIYWLGGLSLNTYYMTYDIINYLHSIGLYGKNEEQEQEQSADLYHYLIFKEVKNDLYQFINEVAEGV